MYIDDAATVTPQLPVGFLAVYYLGQIAFDGFGLILITMMTFRLRETFKDTQYALNNKIFIAIHVATVIAFSMIVTFEIWDISDSLYEISSDASIFLIVFLVLDVAIQMWLIYLFASKLYKTNVLKSKLYDSHETPTSSERHYMSQVMIDSATRQCFLAICAMLFDCMYSGVALVRNLLGHRNDASLNVYVLVWYIAILPTWTKLLCIYLQFGYMASSYDRICKCCHLKVKAMCSRFAMRNVESAQMQHYQSLYDL